MNSPELQNPHASYRLSVAKIAALPLLCAMVGFQTAAVFNTQTTPHRFFLFAVGAVLFLTQIAIVGWRASHLERQLKKTTAKEEQKRHSLLIRFPASVAMQTAGVAVLTGPLMLIGGAYFLSLSFQEILVHTLPMLIIFQGTCQFPLLLGVRGSMRNFAMNSGSLQQPFGPPAGFQKSLAPMVIIPAIFAAWTLISESNRFVESQAREWQANSHYLAWEVAVDRTQTADADPSSYALTAFDTVAPEAPGKNPAARTSNRAFNQTSTRASARASNRAFNQTSTRASALRLPTIGPFQFLRFLIPVLLAAVFAGLLLTMRSSLRFDTQATALEKKIELLPEGDIKSSDEQPFLSEIKTLNEAVRDLKTRFDSMRLRKTAAIAEGRDQREMKAQFFAGMSHDLRSPLNSVIGFTDLLAKGLEGDLTDEQNQTVLLIGEEAEKLMVLITDILDSSKLEAGRLVLDHSSVAIVDVMTEAVSEARRLIGTRPIDLLSSMHQGLPIVYVDKIRLRQAIVSLIAKTMSAIDHGALRISTSLDTPATQLRIEIFDSAKTISPAKMEQFQLSLNSLAQTTQGRGGKLGLGIGLARDVVRLHGGELLIGDKNRPHSVFTIILPLDDTPVRA